MGKKPPKPPPQASANRIPVQGFEGDWYYDPTTGEAWRVGNKGGERNLGGTRGRSMLDEFDPAFQSAAKKAATQWDQVFNPETPETPGFELPDFPDYGAEARQKEEAARIETERQKQALAIQKSRGRASTILTGGDLGKAPVRPKTLLGV